jgi:hypothetical protein
VGPKKKTILGLLALNPLWLAISLAYPLLLANGDYYLPSRRLEYRRRKEAASCARARQIYCRTFLDCTLFSSTCIYTACSLWKPSSPAVTYCSQVDTRLNTALPALTDEQSLVLQKKENSQRNLQFKCTTGVNDKAPTG